MRLAFLLFTSNISCSPLPSLYTLLQDSEISLIEKAFGLIVTEAFIEAGGTY